MVGPEEQKAVAVAAAALNGTRMAVVLLGQYAMVVMVVRVVRVTVLFTLGRA